MTRAINSVHSPPDAMPKANSHNYLCGPIFLCSGINVYARDYTLIKLNLKKSLKANLYKEKHCQKPT